ncbi:protein ILRUN [Anopheles darlingi]|uniref:protein ILRUN n=1 Tax=Anopheles darlingi TaxID=43151 RepID=UPI0021002820|nr:protein ILRUN [Anopheles darlingi]XP_049533186.1 protein ILRUN [Anopheles darlingi]
MDQDDNEDPVEAELLQLLAPFSSLVTTDKDELIRQFQAIGANMNQETATFFLEMSNWNLQAAVGCYFDTLGQPGIPSMKFLNDMTIGKGEKIMPNTEYQLKFLVQNSGDIQWIQGTYIALKASTNMPQSTSARNNKIFVPSISSNDTAIVTVRAVSPSDEGVYVTNWAMYTPNGFEFGETISITMEVSKTGTMTLTQASSGGAVGANNIGTIEDGGTIADEVTVEDGDTIDDVDMWD